MRAMRGKPTSHVRKDRRLETRGYGTYHDVTVTKVERRGVMKRSAKEDTNTAEEKQKEEIAVLLGGAEAIGG